MDVVIDQCAEARSPRAPAAPVCVCDRAHATDAVGTPVSVLVGVVAHLPDIDELTAALEEHPDVHIALRQFRAGHFRIDGACRDIGTLMRWLETRADVRSVRRDASTLHIVPFGIGG